MSIRSIGLLATLTACLGCGDNELPCFGLGLPHYCMPPIGLALRTTQSLTPSTDEVHGYYRLLRPIYEELPLLALTEVNTGYFYPPPIFGVTSAYPPLVSAWSAGERESSDPLVAAILADAPAGLTITTLDDESAPPGYTSFWLETHSVHYLSWRVMLERLAPVPDTFTGGMMTPGDGMDVIHSPVGTDDVFTFSLGWGDCVLGCINVHRWVATVHSDGTVDIEDQGGAVIESWLNDRAAALPPLPDI